MTKAKTLLCYGVHLPTTIGVTAASATLGTKLVHAVCYACIWLHAVHC